MDLTVPAVIIDLHKGIPTARCASHEMEVYIVDHDTCGMDPADLPKVEGKPVYLTGERLPSEPERTQKVVDSIEELE